MSHGPRSPKARACISLGAEVCGAVDILNAQTGAIADDLQKAHTCALHARWILCMNMRGVRRGAASVSSRRASSPPSTYLPQYRTACISIDT